MALAKAGEVKVVFSDSEMAALTGMPGGEVYDFMVKSGKEIANLAVYLAPKRTGHMRRTIRSRVTRANATSTRVRIRCTAEYAEYVEFGTQPITGIMWFYNGVVNKRAKDYPRNPLSALGWFGTVGRPVGGRWGETATVGGQKAQHFMGHAMDGFSSAIGFAF